MQKISNRITLFSVLLGLSVMNSACSPGYSTDSGSSEKSSSLYDSGNAPYGFGTGSTNTGSFGDSTGNLGTPLPNPIAGMNPNPTSTPIDSNQSSQKSVEDIYQKTHGRMPTSSELNQGLNYLGQGLSASQFERMIVEAKIEGYYRQYMGRSSDSAGLAYWADHVISHGVVLSLIEGQFRIAPESQIRSFYTYHFKRDPDQAGLDYWINQAASGFSLKAIQREFRLADECKFLCL